MLTLQKMGVQDFQPAIPIVFQLSFKVTELSPFALFVEAEDVSPLAPIPLPKTIFGGAALLWWALCAAAAGLAIFFLLYRRRKLQK